MSDAAVQDAPAGPQPPRELLGAAVLSIASELPDQVVSNEDVAARIGKTDDWIYTRTGIRERRIARPGERLSDCATAAGRTALERAGVTPEELDLVLVATMTPDEATPNTAPLVAHALGAVRAGAMDIGSACSGFLSGISVGAAQIESGRARRVLVIGADFMSRIVDQTSRATAMLFGDGAGAVVLGPTRGSDRIGPVLLRADGSEPESLYATHEERILRMDGHATFRHAVNRMSEITREAVDAAGLKLDDIDLFVYHQANGRILRSVGERLGIASDRVVDCIERTGNTSAASVPHALEVARVGGRLRAGARVVLGAFGAGFNWGGAVLEWGGAHA